ncbi:MAG: protein-glutamate O-methyltransferase CheR [Desulfobacteraceae bacterium]|nr:protein-glutamate O-methyltransferase CheR [Desulfobacteraceae bacterium]MBC2719483.1 protein-glutamate O-methyltransferase CheR [Desulfobacteraceae bacterium]
MKKITPDEVRIFSKYIYDISKIALDQSKAYLIESRLSELLKAQNCSSFYELYQRAKADLTKSLEKKIIDKITTKETYFFRDNRPFELLQHKILPDLIDMRTTKSSNFFPISIRIWSAACSTGQEIYSIAIVIKELLPALTKYNIKILGTDISNTAIAQASYGVFNKFEIERGLTHDKLEKYFIPFKDKWKVKDELRAMVSFSKHNLMFPFTHIGKFDIIFCRNVGIYFNIEDRKKLFNKIADVLAQDGYLIIGATESLTNVCSGFEPKRALKSVYYQFKK